MEIIADEYDANFPDSYLHIQPQACALDMFRSCTTKTWRTQWCLPNHGSDANLIQRVDSAISESWLPLS